jgi:hypothetical protein
MEGVPTKEVLVDATSPNEVERLAGIIESARQGLDKLKGFEGEVITDTAVYREVERLAAEVSAGLVMIPEHIRVASGLPGGVIHSHQEAKNDGLYQVAV